MNDAFFVKLGWWLFVVSACFFIWAAWRAGDGVALAGAIAFLAANIAPRLLAPQIGDGWALGACQQGSGQMPW